MVKSVLLTIGIVGMILLGGSLCISFLPLLLGAIVNLPYSWFGVVFSLTGIASGVLCFVYLYKRNNWFFILIVPAAIYSLIIWF